MRKCTGRGVATTVAAAATVPAPGVESRSRLQFKLQKSREALEGNVQQFTVNMKEGKNLSTLKKTIAVFKPVMTDFQQKHSAYKFQVVVSIGSHKAVDPTVITQPPVVLTSEMVAVYAETAPLNDVNPRLLNFIEVYEQNVLGWVFSKFVSLQLSLWHLDPLRASAFVPLPNWIQTRRAVVNIRWIGDDCFKWAVFAGMHPVDAYGDRMMCYGVPSQDAFFSKLSGNPCSESDNSHPTRVWTAFGCRPMADYHDIYLQLDMLLLATYNLFRVLQSRSGTLLHHSWSCLGCGSQNVTC